MASARFEEGKAYRLTDYAWGWSCELVCVKRNAKSIRFHDTDGEAYTFKLQHDEWDNEEVKCGEGFGHNWLSAKDVIEEDIIRIRGRETAQPEATTTATPDTLTIENDLIASTHGAQMPDYAKPIKGVWELAVSQTHNALEMGKRNIFGDDSLPDWDLMNMGDVSIFVDMAAEQVTLALQNKDHVWEDKELEAFRQGFINAAPDCLDCNADANTDTPWQAPWTWCDKADYMLDADPCMAGKLFAMKHRAEIEELFAPEIEEA